MISSSYPYLPLWVLTILFIVTLLACQRFGMFLRRRRNASRGDGKGASPDADDDAFAMTSVLGLLALLIGFTFSIALQRFDSRSALVIKEANAIGTTWLRVDLLDAPDRVRVRDILRRYVDLRVAFGRASNSREELSIQQQSTAMQVELWNAMVAAVAPFKDSPRASLVISTTNDAIDLAAERMATRQAHIPPRILRTLLLLSLLTAGLVGYERATRPKSTALLLVLFALAMGLVMDLDRPSSGVTRVPQQPMFELQQSMQPAPALQRQRAPGVGK